MTALGFLGPAGTFSELALLNYLERESRSDQIEAAPSIPTLFDAYKSGHFSGIILPLENSIEGNVNLVLDELLRCEKGSLVAEVILPIRHALMSHVSVDPGQIQRIFSHPQALAQCHDTLQRLCPSAQLCPSASTPSGIEEMRQSREGVSAIVGSKELAERYDLSIIREDIQDYADNCTRFALLSTESSRPSGHDCTSLAFSAKKDSPGSLASALTIFSERGINLSKIASRPSKQSLGDYVFFIDCDGHSEDELVAEAMEALRRSSDFVVHLGSFERDRQC